MKDNQLTKHLKKAVSKFSTRPMLQCINYSNDGNLYATDSHVAVKVSEFHSNPTDFILNIFTMMPEDGKYPEVGKFFEFENISCEINVHIGTLLKSVRPFMTKTSFSNLIKMDIKNKAVVLTKDGWPDYEIKMPLEDCEGEMLLSVNVDYLINALEFMNDAINEKKFNNGCAIVKFTTKNKPFKFVFEKYEYLITPVRTDF